MVPCPAHATHHAAPHTPHHTAWKDEGRVIGGQSGILNCPACLPPVLAHTAYPGTHAHLPASAPHAATHTHTASRTTCDTCHPLPCRYSSAQLPRHPTSSARLQENRAHTCFIFLIPRYHHHYAARRRAGRRVRTDDIGYDMFIRLQFVGRVLQRTLSAPATHRSYGTHAGMCKT